MYVPGTVVPDNENTVCVRVANVLEEPTALRHDTVLTDLEPVEVITADEKPALPAHLAGILENVDPSVPESVVEKLGQLLQKYGKAFSVNEYDLGWTVEIKHIINTGDHPPTRQAQCRLPLA